MYVIAIFSKQYAWEVGGRLAALLITYIASESLHNVTFVAKGKTKCKQVMSVFNTVIQH